MGPRTNNHVEGFHHKLNSWINKPPPDTYELIDIFKLIENGVSVEFTSRLMGKSGPKRRAIDIEKDSKYKNLNENLANNVIDLKQFLRHCTYLVNFDKIMNIV